MANVISVADAKRNLSELMSRAAYNNERFLIQRRGKPMAALVSIEDLTRL
ncbi:MAG: type II toxin-antitoxin system Phd/YefM family antitoxin [Dehalococcoidia bacterium]|nr:type II toxin-antitoxin system Phd/YefM family antitoxin [Dehalococcoidia bacterium]